MKTSKTIATASTAAALLAALALPAAAGAEYYIPPGNSAVNQYTESIPGAGGESGGKKKDVTPAQAIGAKNAKQLEQKGEVGEEAAEVAAETAPPADLYANDGGEGQSGGAGGAGGGSGSGGGGNGGANGPGPANPGNGSGSGAGADSGSAAADGVHVNQPAGSSGISSVLGEATGAADEGNIGLWLPLAILATLAGAVVYRLRLRPHGPTA